MSRQVILASDVESLGREGDVIEVADGHARNYLIPQGLAIAATPANLRRVETLRLKREAEVEALRKEAKALAKKVGKARCHIAAPVGSDGKLFGSVTAADIADELKAAGCEVDRKKIVLEHPIKEIGVYDVDVKLHPDVVGTVKVEIVSNVAEAPAETASTSGAE
jgi:large subunit ribosomal protein L9